MPAQPQSEPALDAADARRRTGALILAALLTATPALAHHSGAMFDRSKPMTVTGVVKAFNWTNPHASFSIEVPAANGPPQEWGVEMGSPNNLVVDGWRRSTLTPGDKVTVTLYPLRDGRPGGSYAAVVLADGKRLGEVQP